MTLLEISEATDDTLREMRVQKRFYVRPECKKPFEEELVLMKGLAIIVERWRPRPKTFWQKVNVPRTLYLWWRRIGGGLKIMRMQHAIFERNKGFDFARRHAIRSMLLFSCPRFMQGFLHRRFSKELNKENAARTPTVVEEAEA